MKFFAILFNSSKILAALIQIYSSCEVVIAFLKKLQKELSIDGKLYPYMLNMMEFLGTLLCIIAKVITFMGGSVPMATTTDLVLADITEEIKKLKEIKL
jgi:hypothetical protein